MTEPHIWDRAAPFDQLTQYATLRTLLMHTAPYTGEAFLQAAVRALAEVLHADFAFITRLAEERDDRVDMLAAFRGRSHIEGWSFDLSGTPCDLVFATPAAPWHGARCGAAVTIADKVNQQFDSVRSTDYQAFVGVPLWSERDIMMGHLALFFHRALAEQEKILLLELAELFCLKLQAELHRMLLERSRSKLLSELEQVNARLAHESIIDASTGLYNRRHFDQRLHEAQARQHRSGAPHALLLIDLDNLKRINDDFGHPAGDAALVAVAAALRRCTRRDIEPPYRIGGDEFAVLCLEAVDRAGLEQLGGRITKAVRELVLKHADATIAITVSVGAAISVPGVADLYHQADVALYRAKANGRNTVAVA